MASWCLRSCTSIDSSALGSIKEAQFLPNDEPVEGVTEGSGLSMREMLRLGELVALFLPVVVEDSQDIKPVGLLGSGDGESRSCCCCCCLARSATTVSMERAGGAAPGGRGGE